MAGSSELRAAEAGYREDALRSEKENAPWPWYTAAVLLFCVDRFFKAMALAGASFGKDGIAEFTLFLNKGIAFSIPVAAAVFWPVAAIALAFLLWSFARSLRRSPLAAAVIFFILAGAASNLIDRVTHGATVDYLLFFGRSAVNVADGMILGGLLTLFFRTDPSARKS